MPIQLGCWAKDRGPANCCMQQMLGPRLTFSLCSYDLPRYASMSPCVYWADPSWGDQGWSLISRSTLHVGLTESRRAVFLYIPQSFYPPFLKSRARVYTERHSRRVLST